MGGVSSWGWSRRRGGRGWGKDEDRSEVGQTGEGWGWVREGARRGRGRVEWISRVGRAHTSPESQSQMLSTRRGCWGGVLRCGSGATFRLCCCSSPTALSVTASCFSSACGGRREQELRSGCSGSHLPTFYLPRGVWPPSGEKSQSDWLWMDEDKDAGWYHTGLQRGSFRGSYGVLRAPPASLVTLQEAY